MHFEHLENLSLHFQQDHPFQSVSKITNKIIAFDIISITIKLNALIFILIASLN